MPNIPFIVSGTLYDVDGTTAVVNQKITFWNYTNNEKIHVTTNASGEYTIDLAGWTTQWATSDVVYAYTATNTKNAVVRAIIGSTDAVWDLDIYFKVGELVMNECRIISVFFHSGVSSKTYNIIDIASDLTRYSDHLKVATDYDRSRGMYFGQVGIRFNSGFFVVKAGEDKSSNNQSSGVSNAIGDTTTNAAMNYLIHHI